MKPSLLAAALIVPLAVVRVAPMSQGKTLESEVLVSTLSTEDLKKQVAAGAASIEHKPEVARG